jgi:hypothetical protein
MVVHMRIYEMLDQNAHTQPMEYVRMLIED